MTVHNNNTYLSKEEVGLLYSKYGQGMSLNYDKMSKELGLEKNAMKMVAQTHQFLNRLTKLNESADYASMRSGSRMS